MVSRSLARTGDLPGHGRSTDIQQHQSSFHTRTGTWRICKVCPGTPDGTGRKAIVTFKSKSPSQEIYTDMLQILSPV